MARFPGRPSLADTGCPGLGTSAPHEGRRCLGPVAATVAGGNALGSSTVRLSRDQLARYAGAYWDARNEVLRRIEQGGKGRVLRDVVNRMTAAGVKNLHFLSNRGMLGDDGEGTVDGCHPNDVGMLRQAFVFTQSLATILEHRE